MNYISTFIYLIFFTICFNIELNRNKKRKQINYLSSYLNRNVVTAIYLISFIFMVIFTGVNFVFYDLNLCISILMISLFILLVAFLLSRVCIYINEEEMVKINILGRTIIKLKDIKDIEYGHFVKVKSNENEIVFETRIYYNNIKEIEKVLTRYK